MSVRLIPLAATAAALVVLTACARADNGGDVGAAPAASESAASQQGGLVLRLTQEGGFVPAERIVGRIPEVSVYADGRMITEGPITMQYPGPALPNLQVATIAPDAVAALADEATAAGVRTGSDLGQPNVADAPNTRIDVIRDGTTQSVSVSALGEAMPNDPRLTPAQRESRAKLAAFVEKLRKTGLNADNQPYQAQKIAALAGEYKQPQDGLPGTPQPVAWPGPALPGDYLNPNVKIGCVLADAAAVRGAVEQGKASQTTPWTSGGNQYAITFRPLLPDETGCADLRKQK